MADHRYFSSVEGRAFMRRPGVYLGAMRGGPDGITWDTEQVVAVPVVEITRDLKTWANALRHGDVVERTKADYDAYMRASEGPVEESDRSDSGALDTHPEQDSLLEEQKPRRRRRRKAE